MAHIKRVQGVFSWVVIASEVSHVFCCVLPSLFSVLTLLVGMGLIGVMPFGFDKFHNVMHSYEIPLMLMSGLVVLMGWGLHYISQKMDCHDTGCGHGKCTQKKKKTVNVLKVATVLFLLNVSIYFIFHVGAQQYIESHATAIHEHDRHHSDE